MLFLFIELFYLLALAFPGRLSSTTVTKDSLDSSLLFLRFGLRSLSDEWVSRLVDYSKLAIKYVPRWEVCGGFR
jgi:hypothetical protein